MPRSLKWSLSFRLFFSGQNCMHFLSLLWILHGQKYVHRHAQFRQTFNGQNEDSKLQLLCFVCKRTSLPSMKTVAPSQPTRSLHLIYYKHVSTSFFSFFSDFLLYIITTVIFTSVTIRHLTVFYRCPKYSCWVVCLRTPYIPTRRYLTFLNFLSTMSRVQYRGWNHHSIEQILISIKIYMPKSMSVVLYVTDKSVARDNSTLWH